MPDSCCPQIDLPAPPKRKIEASASSGKSTIRGTVSAVRLTDSPVPISITFKSLKPSASFTISVQSTDTIASIKSQLASETSAPPADAQRLLLKGKALADAKLLKEYSVKDGDTVNLMVKPGFDWDPSRIASSPAPIPSPEGSQDPASLSLSPNPKSQPSRKHHRIPSLVLSPSPSNEALSNEKPLDITLTLDSTSIPSSIATETLSTYHATVSKPEFWDRLHSFLK